MKVGIEFINSAAIRAEMEKDSYTTAELLGTFRHPRHDGNDWTIRLYRAADTLVFDTNGEPVWCGTEDFNILATDYGIDIQLELIKQ